MSARLSKRAQLELQGWKFTAVPRFFREGVLGYNSETGWKSPAYYDYKRPEAWIAAPPAALAIAERRFGNSSPNMAVRWAWGQGNALRPNDSLCGVAALAALMRDAQSSGVVSDIREQRSSCATRPDAELISACREYLGCERIASGLRAGEEPPSSEDWTAISARIRAQGSLLSDAVREQNRLLSLVLEKSAETREGVAMKARVIGAYFARKSGVRGAAVRSLTDDIASLLGG